MATNISGALSTTLRLSGLSSGIDTDSVIKQLMRIESMRVDKVKQDKQLLEWKRDDYRSITNLLRGFKDEYFDYLKPATNLRSAASLSAFKVTYGGADTYSAFTATPGAGTVPGTYTISNVKVAETAKVSSSIAVTGGITGSVISTTINNISALNDNNKVYVNFNGTSKEITIDDGLSGIDAVVTNLNTKLEAAFGTGKITVGKDLVDGNKLTFATSSTNTLSISTSYNTGLSDMLGKAITSNYVINNQNNKFTLSYNNGTAATITVDPGTYADADALAKKIQEKIDATAGLSGNIRVLNQNNYIVLKPIEAPAVTSGNLLGADISNGELVDSNNKTIDVTIGGTNHQQIVLTEKNYATRNDLLKEVQSKLNTAFGANKVMVSMDEVTKELRFEEISSADTIKSDRAENGGLAALGLKGVNASNKLDTSLTLTDLASRLGRVLTPADGDGDNYNIEFTINGKLFQFKSSQTLSEIISTVNGDADANVKMTYDQLNDKLVVESKGSGAAAKVNISDVAGNGNLMYALGLHGLSDIGADSSIDYKDGTTTQTITRSSNDFTVNGIAFSLKATSAAAVEMKVSGDTSKSLDLIKNFVGKYNEIVDKLNAEMSEVRERDYLPLTDEQRDAMSDSEIEKWEEKARSGMLSNDSLLRGFLSEMRNSLYKEIKDAGGSLYSIGITTGTWDQKGKLVINETRLKDALTNNPELVSNIFTKESTTAYSPDMDAASRTKRNEENGIANRINDILQDYITTSRNSENQKGLLLERAGIKGDGSDYQNMLTKQIMSKEDTIATLLDRLTDKENQYYKRFTAMEKALSQMNSQSAWLSQQFGGGQ
ncbi:MAG TPA: flagellar filament capping protein FliD [Clostridia bacterium]|nr:flagellar filament capping protein FliD [Clostridia bacterium]